MLSRVRLLALPGLLTIHAALMAQEFTIVDPDRVKAEGDAAAALVTVKPRPQPTEYYCDILVAGSGPGGIAAAIRASSRGHTVCLTEETDWVGGQFLSVPALDENRFIETTGGTRSYHEFRNRIRAFYRKQYRLAPEAAALRNFNPGACYVSSLCYEPKVGLAALLEMLAPYKVQLFLRTRILSVDVQNGTIRSALAYRFDRGDVIRMVPKFVLDATELGDLLPLAGVPYVAGAEPKSETGEPDASDTANPSCVQSFTYTFAIERRPGEVHRIPKPPQYEKFRDGQPFSLKMNYPVQFGWRGEFQYTMFGDDPPIPNNMSPKPFFSWRRLLFSGNFVGPNAPRDLALMNWPRQDYHDESLIDRSPPDTARVLQQAKRVALAFLYWLQTDLRRDDGRGNGYPELALRKDVMGTADGLSKYPYIRESRHLRAKGRVTQQDIVIDSADESRARPFADSVGTGFYMVDIHPCGANERGRMMMPKPFQIPYAALIPQGVNNLLAAGKNLGVTHLSNGAFRLHPIEWNIGESAAVAASLALRSGGLPQAAKLQSELVKYGVPLVWFDDLPVDHPGFAAIHLAAIRGLYPRSKSDLHASPDAPVTRGEAARILATYFGKDLGAKEPATLAVEHCWMAVDHRNWFHADLPFYWTDWREDQLPGKLPPLRPTKTGPVSRAELARRLTGK
jgi:hypothetical protein